jgi:hypothetical protein
VFCDWQKQEVALGWNNDHFKAWKSSVVVLDWDDRQNWSLPNMQTSFISSLCTLKWWWWWLKIDAPLKPITVSKSGSFSTHKSVGPYWYCFRKGRSCPLFSSSISLISVPLDSVIYSFYVYSVPPVRDKLVQLLRVYYFHNQLSQHSPDYETDSWLK